MTPLDFGSVVSRSFTCFGRNWLKFSLVVGALLLPVLFANLFLISTIPELEAMQPKNPNDSEEMQNFLNYMLYFMSVTLGVALLQICLQSLATATLVYGTFEDMRGNAPSMGECLKVALKKLPMLILLGIILGLIVGIGSLFCCVPGIIGWVFFYFVIPVAVVEGGGMGSFSRSIDLVKGSFWPILGIGLVFVIGVGLVCNGLISQIFTLIDPNLGVIVGWFTGIFATTLIGIAQTVSYHDVRVNNEGLADDDLAIIFD